jgi:hypothetical protein
MTLDRYLDDFGHDLTRAAGTQRRRGRNRRLVLIPGAAALGLAAAALIPGLGGDSDTLAKARAALAPKGEIVHMAMHYELPGNRDNRPGIDQWYVDKPLAWRSVMQTGRGKRSVEVAVSGDRLHIHASDRDVVTIYRGYRTPLSAPGIGGGDPVEQVREMLAKGDVRDDGIVTEDGRQVRRLVGEHKGGKALRPRTIYLMDPQTFAPLAIRYEIAPRKGSTRLLMSVKIDKYERLPVNAETSKLLRIQHKTPDTKYVWREVKHR